MSIIVRELRKIEEFRKCEKMPELVWGKGIGIIPVDLMCVYSNFGGVVLGAFDEKDKMIGFSIAFPGMLNGKTYLHSHMLGLLEEERLKGLGFKIKVKQREVALRKGYDLVCWTFDPLQGVNANFNFRKLGVISNKYFRNFYGEMRDRINVGLESDRLFVEWWIRSRRVSDRMKGKYSDLKLSYLISEGAEIADETKLNDQHLRFISSIRLDLRGDAVLVEIPSNIQKIKSLSMDLAADWRLKTRKLFENYLSKGYLVVDFISEVKDGVRRNFYLLRKCRREDVL